MACARFPVSIKRVPSVAIPTRRFSTTTIQNTRSTFNVKFNYQPGFKLFNPLLLPTSKLIFFSRNFATSAKEFENEITRHMQQKDFNAAESSFKQMREQKIIPTQPLLSSMIIEFAAAGRSDKSLEFYDVLRKSGFSPDENILNIVVGSLSQKFKTSAKIKQAEQEQPPPKLDTVPNELMDLQHPEITDEEDLDYDEEDMELGEDSLEEKENINAEKLTDHPIIIVHETGSNVFATATHQGKTLTSLSAGALGFKGSKRSTSVAAEALGRGVSQRLLERGYNSANIVLRTTPSSNSEGALKGLFATVQLPQSRRNAQLEIKYVAYHLCLAHNGCRPRKPRRV